MKSAARLAALLIALTSEGCVGPASIHTYGNGGLFSDTTLGVQASENGYVGPPPFEGCSWGILGLAAVGDSSIETARKGELIKIGVFDYVDYSRQTTFGVSKFCTKITGYAR